MDYVGGYHSRRMTFLQNIINLIKVEISVRFSPNFVYFFPKVTPRNDSRSLEPTYNFFKINFKFFVCVEIFYYLLSVFYPPKDPFRAFYMINLN